MSLDKFHLFPLLPPELRHEIYLFATPPRIVHVQQDAEDEEQFQEWFDSIGPSHIKLHPSLTYFAHNWRNTILRHRDFRSQSRLEKYGFTNSKPMKHPWKPSRRTPDIPVHWLLDHVDIAYQLLRKTRLYSQAPIPALLHTCAESRKVLISAGYRLAFGTRHHEPSTWFHFENDILFLKPDRDIEEPALLDNGHCGIGDFDIDSLQRVRKLALIGPISPRGYSLSGEPVLDAVRLLPNLDQVYYVEWDMEDFDECFTAAAKTALGRRSAESGRPLSNYERQPWRCIPIEEVDGLFRLIGKYPYEPWKIGSIGFRGEILKHFDGPTGTFFQLLVDYKMKCLEEERDKIVEEESVSPWQIPRVEIVHICTEPIARRLFADRHELWKEYVSLKERQRLLKQQQEAEAQASTPIDLRPTNILVNSPVVTNHRPMSPTPTDVQWEDDWEAFHDAHVEYVDYDDYMDMSGWYTRDDLLAHRPLFPPRQELILEP
ncbi:hypothetical protein F4804DRAFT_296370 [Jackrogersella minutella]|nr:hypothetical protein F4804DRAFT_296370 [Jackrogersella minutella]